MMKKLVTACAVVLFLMPGLSKAQDYTGISIGPRLGYYKAKDADDGNFYGGVELRARLSNIFGLEGAVDYRTSSTYDLGPYSANVRQIPVTASAMIFLPVSEHFQPYGLAGLGSYYTIIDYDSDAESAGASDDHSVDFGYHLGFGADLRINQSAAFNVDYRYIFLDPGSDTFGDVGDADFSGNLFTVGLTFYL